MTRREFLDETTSWDDLMSFAYDHEIYFEEVFDEEEKDSFYNNKLVDMADYADNWMNLLDMLNDIPNGEDWYIYDEDDDRLYPATDEDLDEYIERVDEMMDWDGEEDEEEPFYQPVDRYLEPEDNFEIEDEENLMSLFVSSSESVHVQSIDEADIMTLLS